MGLRRFHKVGYVPLVAAALLAGACSGDDGGDTSNPSSTPAPPSTASTEMTAPSAPSIGPPDETTTPVGEQRPVPSIPIVGEEAEAFRSFLQGPSVWQLATADDPAGRSYAISWDHTPWFKFDLSSMSAELFTGCNMGAGVVRIVDANTGVNGVWLSPKVLPAAACVPPFDAMEVAFLSALNASPLVAEDGRLVLVGADGSRFVFAAQTAILD